MYAPTLPSSLLKALGDDTRLRLLALVSDGETCVCHLAAALDLTQPNTSQHLTVLRNAGVVERVRRGNWIYYHLAVLDPARAAIVSAVYAALPDLPDDRRRLDEVRARLPCP